MEEFFSSVLIYIYISPIKIFHSKDLKSNLASDWNPVLTIGGWRSTEEEVLLEICKEFGQQNNRKEQKYSKWANKE